MSARSSGAGASALAALLVACALAACGDTAPLAAPSVAPPPRRAAATAADTTYLPAARLRARTLALALADPAARARLRDALRRSPLATHRLTMEKELALPRGEALLRALARESGVAVDSLRALFAAGPALDLLLPRSSDRRNWRPDRPLVVAVADGRRAPPRVVYAATGDSAAALPRDAAYLLLAPAGDRSRRIRRQADVAGDAVEDPDDGSLSGTLTYVGPRGDTTRVDVADMIADYRTLPISAPPAERDRVLAELRAARASTSTATGPRRLLACIDPCEGGALVGWRDTTYLVAFYERGGPEPGADATYEPWFDGYYRGNRWRLQFDGVVGNDIVFVDAPFMNARAADHSAATVKVIGGEDDGSWPDGACVASGMRFAGARYTRDPGKLAVTLTRADTYTWRHCGGYEDADTWGAQLRWTFRSRPAVAALSVELDTLYMSATALELPGLQAVPKYKGAYRYAYSGCPSVYYLVGTTADGEPLDTTSLSVFATTTSSTPSVAEPSRPMNGILRNYTPGTTTLTATLDGVTGQGSYGVIPFITGIVLSPAQAAVAPGTAAVERLTWTGSSTGRCPMPYRNVAALRPLWSSSTPSLGVALAVADSSVVWATPSVTGSYTLTASIGPLRAQATVIGELAPAAAPVARGTFTTTGASVSWSAVTGARGYTIYRRVDGGAWQEYGSTSATSITDATPIDFAYAGVSPGTAGTEDFQVAAWNYGGSGPLSNAVGFKVSSVAAGDGGGGGSSSFYSRARTGVRRIGP